MTAIDVAAEAREELMRAKAKHAPMHGPHEGYAVILEELDELWDEVKAQKPDSGRMRKEALQVAAMALRFIEDVCDRVVRPLNPCDVCHHDEGECGCLCCNDGGRS